MSLEGDWTAGHAVALVVAALVAGAGLATWRARAHPTRPDTDEPAFAAPVVRSRRATLGTRLLDGFQKAARPLPDTLFADPDEQGTPQFAQVAGPLLEPDVQVRALGRPEGSFLRRRSDGWHAFEGQRWVGVKREKVPETVRTLWPDADPRALHREPPSRDGEVEP